MAGKLLFDKVIANGLATDHFSASLFHFPSSLTTSSHALFQAAPFNGLIGSPRPWLALLVSSLQARFMCGNEIF